MSTSTHNTTTNNIIDIFSSKRAVSRDSKRFTRLSPEFDGLCMLYSTNKNSPDKLYTMRIPCWAIRANGEVEALVPWLNRLTSCHELEDPDHGKFEGYYDLTTEEVFYHPPHYKVTELESASQHRDNNSNNLDLILQEIPDTIGTHAMLTANEPHSLVLTEVISWRLLASGKLQAMLIDESKVEQTPVLAGDPCLYPAEENPNFRYFFQHQVANQLKSEDPEALAAIALLLD